jgi:RNA polymerase sigma-70 factor, ECF subfamily
VLRLARPTTTGYARDRLNPRSTSSHARATADDDAALLRAIAARDPAALASLYDRHGGLLFALCLRIVKDRMAAEEALEDVFWEIWSKFDRFDPQRGAPLSYLLNLTQSRALDKLRSGAKHRRMQLATDRDSGSDRPTLDPSAAAPAGAGPVEQAAGAEQRQTVRRAVGTLAPEQRQAVELAFFDGFTHVEIAEKLAVPLGTIKTRIRQGLVRLREALGGALQPGREG